MGLVKGATVIQVYGFIDTNIERVLIACINRIWVRSRGLLSVIQVYGFIDTNIERVLIACNKQDMGLVKGATVIKVHGYIDTNLKGF